MGFGCPAPRRQHRPAGQRQDRVEGELGQVQVQPRRRRRGQREPQPGAEDGHLQLDRHEPRPHVPTWRAGCVDRQRSLRQRARRSEPQAAGLGAGDRRARAAAHRRRRRARRVRVLHGQQPDQHVSESAARIRLHRTVRVRR